MDTPESLYQHALSILKGGQSVKAVETLLLKDGHDPVLIKETVCRLKLEVYKRRKARGVTFMVAGGILLLTGFIATVFLFHANKSFDIFMYGFTLAGTGLMGYGTYEILQ